MKKIFDEKITTRSWLKPKKNLTVFLNKIENISSLYMSIFTRDNTIIEIDLAGQITTITINDEYVPSSIKLNNSLKMMSNSITIKANVELYIYEVVVFGWKRSKKNDFVMVQCFNFVFNV